MNISKTLIFFTILILLCANAKAQCDLMGQKLLQEPIGIFPNELEGFKFFGEGKLSSLQLGVSTREDVAKVFGEPTKITNNEEFFDYDSDWTIIIGYFNKNSGMSFSSVNNSISRSWRVIPEYVGKIETVRLWAKKKIPFNQVIDPDKFVNQISNDIFNYTMYWDGYGLRYKLFKSYLDERQAARHSYSKGDMMQIEYHIECPIERKIFIEKKPIILNKELNGRNN
jgi:hypothetical protein